MEKVQRKIRASLRVLQLYLSNVLTIGLKKREWTIYIERNLLIAANSSARERIWL
jgi:hypothetical protein